MKTVFMGTPDFAIPVIESLIDAYHEIPLIVTNPDRPANRGKINPSPVKAFAMTHNIPVATTERIKKDEELISRIKCLAPDFIVVYAFGQILPQEVLDIPRYGCINVHASLLPKFRGASPVQAAILANEQITGITIMKMDAGLDTGDIIETAEIPVEHKNSVELIKELSEAARQILPAVLDSIAKDKAVYTKQDDSKSSKSGIIKKEDGATDFKLDANDVDALVRAYYEWPSVYTFHKGNKIKIHEAQVLKHSDINGNPGTCSKAYKDELIINCKSGQILIKELQLEGKKRMKTKDFLNGYSISEGDKFCKEIK